MFHLSFDIGIVVCSASVRSPTVSDGLPGESWPYARGLPLETQMATERWKMTNGKWY